MDTSGTVTLMNVEVSRFETGVYVKKGVFKMTEGSITGNGAGSYGVRVGDGDVKLSEVEISKGVLLKIRVSYIFYGKVLQYNIRTSNVVF
uniref:Uncharacterized protein n=1 Tax=Bartonella schoenbuchensis (strain DSM 13525 / NCTC 13165 / R1) TaxID=687861 RepID=E6Z0U0_BARSR|nr:hypothetical protein BARSC_180001 [Bartonella schoenbuchensis R1]